MDTGRPLVCERARSHVLGAVRTHAFWLCQHSPQPAAFSSALRFSSAIPGPAASRYFCAKVKCDNFVDDCDLTVTLSPPAPS